MQTKRFKRAVSLILCIVLIAAMALFTGCSDKKANTVGDGDKSFTFIVVDGEGAEETFEVKTDAQTVGEALMDEGLIEGEEGQYGLYVKVVNGITADYDKDGTYWAFYIGEEYAMTGVDMTDIEDGETYAFKVEKG